MKGRAVRASRAARFADLRRDFEAARDAGHTHKIWRTVGDEAVRGSHAGMAGARVGIEDAFDVDGERLFLPSDPAGSFEQTANCRCFVEYVTEGAGEGDGDMGASDEVRKEDLSIEEDFLNKQEGFLLKAKVPARQDGTIFDDSGATVGGGVDLGQQSEDGLRKRGVPEALIAKLRPYLGLRREAADRFLAANPLTLTRAEAQLLTDRVRGDIGLDVARNFNRDSHLRFQDLPPAAQSVIASVATQYGPNLNDPEDGTPRFWRFVTQGDWQSALEELLDFRDDFAPRRKREAKKLLEAFPNLKVPEGAFD